MQGVYPHIFYFMGIRQITGSSGAAAAGQT